MQIDSIEFGCTKSKIEDYMTGSKEVVGSSPIFSTTRFPNVFINNMLGFFIVCICAIIVRSDIKSLKNLTKKSK